MASQYYTPLSNGLQSFADASPEYEFADVGIGSFREQAGRLAEFGRNGDIYVVHAAEGETVIPTEVLDANPKVRELLFEQMRGMGLDPQEYVVGNELNSRNPVTGMPEFFFRSIFRSVKKAVKKVANVAKEWAPLVLPIAASVFGVPFLGPAFGAGTFGAAFLGSGIGSLAGGASVKDSIKSGLMAGATSAAFSGLSQAGTGGTFMGGVKGSLTGKMPVFNTEGAQIGTRIAASPGAGSDYALNLGNYSPQELGAAQAASDAQLGKFRTLDVFGGTTSGSAFDPASGTRDVPGFLPSGDPSSGTSRAPRFVTDASNRSAATPDRPPPRGDLPLTADNLRAYNTDGVETNAELFNRSFSNSPLKDTATPSGGSGKESWYDTFTNYAFQGGESKATLEGRGQEAYNKVFSNARAQNVPITSETMKTAEAARAAAMDPGALAKYGPTLGLGTLAYLALKPEEKKQRLASLEKQRNQMNPLLEESPEDYIVPVNTSPTPTRGARDLVVPTTYPFRPAPRRRPVMFSNQGGLAQFPRREMLVEGPGTERSDDIPAMLSDGEFVLNARSVRGADPTGQGNRHRGAQNLYRMMRDFEMRA
jgi:hypothetical protein